MSDDYLASLGLAGLNRRRRDADYRADFGCPLHPRFAGYLDRQRARHEGDKAAVKRYAPWRDADRTAELAQLEEHYPDLHAAVMACFFGVTSQRAFAKQVGVSQPTIAGRVRKALQLIDLWAYERQERAAQEAAPVAGWNPYLADMRGNARFMADLSPEERAAYHDYWVERARIEREATEG